MQAFFMAVLSSLGSVVGGMAGKIFLNAGFWEWAILWCAKKYVQSTATTADDEWYQKLEQMLKEAKNEK